MSDDEQREEILDGIEALAADGEPDRLLEMSVATSQGELYDAAGEAFGSWDAALAEALCRAVRDRTSAGGRAGEGATSGGGRSEQEEKIARKAGPEATHPLFVMTEKNAVFRVPGPELELSDAPQHFEVPPNSGAVAHVHHIGEPEGVILYSNQGRYFGLDPRLVPKHRSEQEVRRLESMLGMESGEVLEYVLPRKKFFGGRIIHVTEQGKGKASATSDYDKSLDKEPREAFLLNDGDRPVAVMAGPQQSSVFCASALGRGIHFPASDLRTMGLRAVGVNVMKLQDDQEDAVVGAFLGQKVRQVALITAEGLGKRVEFEEFRQQGRAGAGMQLARLNHGDRIAGVAPVHPSDDVVVTTDRGRVHRRAAADFELMGRPAKGNRVMELADGERILEFGRLPCSG